MNVNIYTHCRSSRLEYITELIEKRSADINIRIVHDIDNLNPESYIICYGKSHLESNMDVPFHNLIEEGTMKFALSGSGSKDKARPFVFEKDDFPDFDVFSAIFFLLTRIEEYGHEDMDRHQRFPYIDSWMFKYDALEFPLVDIWIKKILNSVYKFYNRELPKPVGEISLSFDVDFPWYKRNVSTARSLVRGLKSRMRKELQADKYEFMKSDPFDTFDGILSQLDKNNKRGIWFFLLSTESRYDAGTSHRNEEWQGLFEKIGKNHETGIHPSYRSSENMNVLQKELREYKKMDRSESIKSRQHYLRFQIPQTYWMLDANGIAEDHSLGYAGHIGFRAGTAYPFSWYDIVNESKTDLKVHPLHIMDVTLYQYMNLSPEKALEYIEHFAKKIKKTGGELNILWHNSFFAGTRNPQKWWEVFEESVRL